MQAVFLGIIAALGAIYAIWTKQGRIFWGFLIMAISFVLSIPDLATGVKADVLGAVSMVIFAAGVLVTVFKKKEEPNDQEKEIEKPKEEEKK